MIASDMLKDRILAYADLVKFHHSVFALPFALISLLVATNGRPGWRILILVILAMVAARTAAMTFNRIVDLHQDALNPRTRLRPSVTGRVSKREAYLLCFLSCLLFVWFADLLNPLCLVLSPVVLLVLLFYSYTKRFTNWPHVFLGIALGLAPLGAWVAATGKVAWSPIPLGMAVVFWVAGFDIIYSFQDEEFDKSHGIGSLVVRFGPGRALLISRVFHVLTVMLLLYYGQSVSRGLWYYLGVAIVSVALFVEQCLVTPTDRSRINMAFFTANGFVGVAHLVFTMLDIYR